MGKLKFRSCCMVLLFLVSLTAWAKKEQESVYIFGVSISFNDSVAYVTNIQKIDGIKLEPKTGFLPNRSYYMYQLRDYLINNKGAKNPTCMVFYSKKTSKIEKKFLKVVKRLRNNPKVLLSELGGDFGFVKAE